MITTYLCYSPTCTPAQLSLLSEAIAKYSAFLERKERKSVSAIISNVFFFHSDMGYKMQKQKDTGLIFFSTYRREVLVLTREEDDRMKTRQGDKRERDKDTQVNAHKHDGDSDIVKETMI